MSYIESLRKLVGNKEILSVACGAIIENEHNEILLQLRSDTKDYGVPGGNLELGESLIEALIREVKEETGILISADEAKLFGVYSGNDMLTTYPNGDEVQYVCLIFYVKMDSPDNLAACEESGKIAFYSRKTMPNNLKPSDRIWVEKWMRNDFELEVR